MTPKWLLQQVALILIVLIGTSATLPPVLAIDTASSLQPFLEENHKVIHVSITETISQTADPASIIHTESDHLTLNILNPLETGIADTTYTPNPSDPTQSSVDTTVTKLLTLGYSLKTHSQHIYTASATRKDGSASIPMTIAVAYYVFTNPDPTNHPDQLLTVTQLVDDQGYPLDPKTATTSPLDGTLEQILHKSTVQTSPATERTPLIQPLATGLCAGVMAGATAGLVVGVCVGIAIAAVVYCVYYCYNCIMYPQYETTEIPVNNEKPIYEFTLVKNTNGHGTYVPPGSIITYLDDGSAKVQYPYPWWKRPFAYGTIKHYVPISTDIHKIPRCIECPNGALVDYGTKIDDPTIVYDNEDKDTPLLTIYTQSQANPTSRKPLELLDDSNPAEPYWVEWANITPSSSTHYTSFSATWNVPKNPLKTEEYTSDKNGNMFYAWIGIQTKDKVTLPHGYYGGVNQPVLTWNCGHLKPSAETCTGYPKEEHWTGAAWTAPTEGSGKPTMHGNIINVNKGDVIKGSLDWNEKDKSWSITFIDTTTGGSSTLIAPDTIPNDVKYTEPYFALEKYPPQLNLICNNGRNKDFWPQGNFKFTNIILKNQNRNDITAQSRVKATYNEGMFKIKSTGKQCTLVGGLPTFEPGHYWVDITHWPTSVTLEIPSTN